MTMTDEAPEKKYVKTGTTVNAAVHGEPRVRIKDMEYVSVYSLTAEREKVAALEAERDALRRLLDDQEYLRTKAKYLSGQLSFVNWIEERERSALDATKDQRG